MTTTEAASELLALGADGQDLLFRAARTANAFTDEPVTDEQLRAVYDLMRWAPTSANCQPLRVLALRGADSRRLLVPHMFGSNQAKTETAPLTLLLASDRRFDRYLPTLAPFLPDPAAMFRDDEARAATADFNAALQAGYLILAIRAAGLAAGPMAGFDAAGVDAEFFPDGRYHAVLVMNVGRPAPGAWFERSPRLGFDDVVSTI